MPDEQLNVIWMIPNRHHPVRPASQRNGEIASGFGIRGEHFKYLSGRHPAEQALRLDETPWATPTT